MGRETELRSRDCIRLLTVMKADAAGRTVKKALRPARKRVLVEHLQVSYAVSQRRACWVLCLARSTCRYESIADERAALRRRLRELAATRVRYGYRRLHILLRREGWDVVATVLYRLYQEEGLAMSRRSPRRRRSVQTRPDAVTARRPNECWSMDFMASRLCSGHRFRLLTIVDNFSRESLAIEVGQRLTGDDVVSVLDRVARQRGRPETIRVDNGPEFIGKSLDLWAYWNGVTLDFSRPGKPTDNAFIESFNGTVREECLNQHWFMSLKDAQEKLDVWRRDYNHSSHYPFILCA